MKSTLLIVSLAFASAFVARADVKLPAVIGSHMVLQRDQSCPIWGWADPGEEITVEFAGQKRTTVAGKDGAWSVKLRPLKASAEPRQLIVRGKNTVTLDDVLVGEVWLCSGQSNMEWTVANSDNPQEEIANAKHPRIRHIKIPHRPSDKPESDVPTDGWQVCTPETVSAFTAVGYYYGRQLMQELDVPIGLLGCNWGGTRIEPWTPPAGFHAVPALKKDFTDKLATFPTKTETKSKDGKVTTAINHQTPLALYNGMVHPLVPFAIRGAIWYQGESNNGEAMLYHEKMKALIAGWRKVWDNPRLPFYFVQLAPFTYRVPPERLPGIWEAQLATLEVPHTGMAVTTDIGNIKDIHPKNKQEVGRRLALWALTKTYGRNVGEYSGPLFDDARVRDGKIELSFDHAGSGLKSRDGKPLTHFTIAGADQKFVPAKAEIVGRKVVVSSDAVTKPVAVRFAWHQEAEPNLANAEGLPASPFRTDNWPVVETAAPEPPPAQKAAPKKK
jgi:sialate O-acetylesterase